MNYASMHIKHIRVGSWVGVKWEWHSEMGNTQEKQNGARVD